MSVSASSWAGAGALARERDVRLGGMVNQKVLDASVRGGFSFLVLLAGPISRRINVVRATSDRPGGDLEDKPQVEAGEGIALILGERRREVDGGGEVDPTDIVGGVARSGGSSHMTVNPFMLPPFPYLFHLHRPY